MNNVVLIPDLALTCKINENILKQLASGHRQHWRHQFSKWKYVRLVRTAPILHNWSVDCIVWYLFDNIQT